MVWSMFTSLQQKKEFKKVWILDVLHMLVSSWNNVPATTISNCFRKVNFVHSNDAEVIPLQENENNSNDFNVDEEKWKSISLKLLSLKH